MIIFGLTGSIGMGKSTCGAMLKRLGVSVHDADAAVHDVMVPGGKAMPAMRAAFPAYAHPEIYKGKTIDRKALGRLVFNDEAQREKLEAILHPLVRESQQSFLRESRAKGVEIAALDIPLLFETGGEARVDYTINCSAPAFIQRARVLMRPGMDEAKFHAILKAQMPDGEKSARADFVVKTGLGRAHVMKQLKTILNEIKNERNCPRY